MMIEAQERGGVEREGFCELGSITQFVVPEFLFFDARIAEQPEHLNGIGGKGNRQQVRLDVRVHSGWLAYGLGCSRPNGMPAAGSTPSEPNAGFSLHAVVRVVLRFAADCQPERIGHADFVLQKSAVQMVRFQWWRERDGISRRDPGDADRKSTR